MANEDTAGVDDFMSLTRARFVDASIDRDGAL
jgi:hypothetical protein